jgi:hypothetical protein
MTEQWAATADFVAVQADGSRRPIRVCIGIPSCADPAEWRCVVAIDGLQAATSISGNDAVQALGLAWRFVAGLLMAFEARGGHFEFTTGGTVLLSAYFPR